MVVNWQTGQCSFWLRSFTVTTTWAASNLTPVTVIPGRSIKRVNTVVTRTGALPSSVVFSNS